jgi:ABC-2 type transport system permease protein
VTAADAGAVTSVDSPAASATAGRPPRRSPTLAGTAALARFVLRYGRVRIPVWIVAIAMTIFASAASVKGLYPTQADLDAAAAPMYDNAAVIALQGPTYAIDTLGGNIVFNIGGFGYVLMGLMGMFLVGRNTRADEEAGRTELLRAAVVGRNAPVTAALAVTTGALAVLGALITLSMLALGLPTPGSVAYGAAMAGFGTFFAAVNAVTAQVTEHNRTAYGLSGAALAVSFVVRAVGDVGGGTLSWASPMGWAQSMKPYAGERWWPLLLLLGGAAGLVAVAFALLGRRDLGGGLLAVRPGPPTAARWLTRPWGLAVRLQRGAVIAWGVGLLLGGIVYGTLGDDVADLIGDNDDLANIIAQSGGDLTDSYFSTAIAMLAVIAGGFTVSSVLRARSEETAGHAEPLLATALGRVPWLGSHLAVAVVGSALMTIVTGLGAGVTYALVSGDGSQVTRLTGAALAYTPALWVLAGVAVALIGWAPRAAPLAWAAFAWCALVAFLGQLLDLPRWALDLSPFEHVPSLPAADVDTVPLAVLTLVAGALTAAGLVGFRRRDAGY